MNNKRLTRDQNTLNNGLIGNVIDSNLPYFSTWEDLSQRTLSNRNDNQNDNNRINHNNRIINIKNRIDLNEIDNVLTGASNSPTIHQQDNHCTKNQINNNNNFNGNLSANYQSFHGTADRLVEEEVELFENNQTELRETHNDEYEDDDENCEDEILADYTRNTLRSTLQSNNYLHNTTLGHRLLMIDSTHSTATITSLQQQLNDTDNQDSQSGSGGGITNQAFIGLHSCYGYPKCENMNCGNCNKAQLTANIGDHLANSNSSWFSVASNKSKTIFSLGCCAILTTCLFILLAIVSVVGISIYLGNLTQQNKSNVLPLSGHFKIQNGDQFNDNLYNISSKEFQLKATKYEAIVSILD